MMPLVKRKPLDSPLRAARRTRTMTQQQLASIVGITQESLSEAERGILRLSPDVRMRLAAILGVSPEHLFPDLVTPERTV